MGATASRPLGRQTEIPFDRAELNRVRRTKGYVQELERLVMVLRARVAELEARVRGVG